VLAVAAGGVLAMVEDTMVLESFSEAHILSGMMTVLGFITSFALSMAG
jgi:ZIP family zinc transporter